MNRVQNEEINIYSVLFIYHYIILSQIFCSCSDGDDINIYEQLTCFIALIIRCKQGRVRGFGG